MKREIKFRAWDKKEKKMYSPTLIVGNASSLAAIYGDMEKIMQVGVAIVFSDDLVLMQFTGLKDKNGKEIYEGDIVQAKDPQFEGDIYNYEINFSDGCFWGTEITDEKEKQCHFACRLTGGEVVGNICENKELLPK